jgi:arabinofuranan 3-O-arabinosyltransferase
MPPAKSRLDIVSLMALALIGLWIVAIGTAAATLSQGWITTSAGTPAEGDYLGIYAAGKLAKKGEPSAVYNLQRHRETQRQLDGNPGGGFYPWGYPPTFLFVAGALALLPYYASMLTWTIATFAAFAAAIARISASRRDMLLMLATPAPWFNLYIGQNGALTAALMGFGLVLLPTRPLIAGIAIGLLSFKPHLGSLIPLALLTGGYYRAFAAAALTAVAAVVFSIVAFGIEPWLMFPQQLTYIASIIETAAEVEKIVTLFGFARGLGFSAQNAFYLQLGLSALLAILIGWLWSRRSVSFDLKAATLAAAATLATPYLFAYDLVMLTIAQAFLLRHLSTRDFTREDAYSLLAANGLVLMFNKAPTLPLGFFGSVVVMGLILRHVWKEAGTGARDFSAAEKIAPGCLASALSSGKT